MRSDQLTTVMPGTASTAVTMRAAWASSAALTVTSRTISPAEARTMSIAPMSPPASAIAAATRLNAPTAFG